MKSDGAAVCHVFILSKRKGAPFDLTKKTEDVVVWPSGS